MSNDLCNPTSFSPYFIFMLFLTFQQFVFNCIKKRPILKTGLHIHCFNVFHLFHTNTSVTHVEYKSIHPLVDDFLRAELECEESQLQYYLM